jgi:hypothetical protein
MKKNFGTQKNERQLSFVVSLCHLIQFFYIFRLIVLFWMMAKAEQNQSISF